MTEQRARQDGSGEVESPDPTPPMWLSGEAAYGWECGWSAGWDAAVAALREMPVEQRMAAMGMRPYRHNWLDYLYESGGQSCPALFSEPRPAPTPRVVPETS